MKWTGRLWNLLRRSALNRELDEELLFHLDARTGHNIRSGMTPSEAREDALRRFGNRTLMKERTREVDLARFAESAAQDLCYAFRCLRRSPGFTVVAIVVIALGIGANTAVFTLVNSVLLRPLPFPESDRLFLISNAPERGPFGARPSLVDRDYLEFVRQDRNFENIATYTNYEVTLTRAGDPVRVPAASATPDFLRVLRVNPAAGRAFLPGESDRSRVVLLSDRLWRSRFAAAPGALGKTITLDGVPHTVIGILPSGFDFPSGAELWTPLEVRLDPHNSYMRPVVGRLKPGVSPQQAEAALKAFVTGLHAGNPKNNADFVARVLPLKDTIVGDIRKSLLVFAGAVAFVLVIACANVANLLLTRAASRRREISVRAALGAGKWRLIRQLLTESALVSLAGGAGGLLLAKWGVPALLALAPEGKIPRADQVQLDGWVLAFTLGLSAFTGIAFGLLPAVQATRRELRESLNEGGRTLTGRREGLRSALVVSEIAIALVLLTGAGLLLKSFLRTRSVSPGFRAENVLTVSVDLPDSAYRTAAQMQAFHTRFLAKLSNLPAVLSAGAVNWIPLRPELVQGDFQLEGGRRLPPGYMVDKPVVSPAYFRAMGIRLLAGREFSERDDAAAPGVAIVTRSVANSLWRGEDPIGKRISMEDRPKPEDWLTIVGMVDDVRQKGLTTAPSPAIYQPVSQVTRPFFLSHMTFVLRTASNPLGVASGIREVLREVDRDQPVSIATMEDVIAGTTAEPRFQTRLMGAFSLLALLLSAIGVYGVLSCSVADRRHEIGIRMALGAASGDVVRMVLLRTLALAATGVALGTLGAVAVTRVLSNFLFEVTPTDPATFLSVAALLAAVALLAGLLPAYRGSRVPPLLALRHE